jgi:predicted nuclease of predicted toxin-antitoxin system
MRFKIDENLPVELAELLIKHGHDAETVSKEGMKGTDDPPWYQRCQEEKRILITFDLGFTDIRTYPPAQSQGIVVLRLPQQDKHSVFGIAEKILKLAKREPIPGHLWIVERHRIRIRE